MSQKDWITLLVAICSLLGVLAFAYGVGQTGSELEEIVFLALSFAFLGMSFILSQRGRNLPE